MMIIKDAVVSKNLKFISYLEFKFLKRMNDFAKLYKKPLDYRAKELASDKNL